MTKRNVANFRVPIVLKRVEQIVQPPRSPATVQNVALGWLIGRQDFAIQICQNGRNSFTSYAKPQHPAARSKPYVVSDGLCDVQIFPEFPIQTRAHPKSNPPFLKYRVAYLIDGCQLRNWMCKGGRSSCFFSEKAQYCINSQHWLQERI